MTQVPKATGHGKAEFSHIYNEPDPRQYYNTLGALGYRTPQQGLELFNAIRRAQQDLMPTGVGPLLDVCCSYGVNAALYLTDLTLPDVYERYASPDLADLSTQQLIEEDRKFYAEHFQADAPEMFGVDVAENAVDYAKTVGLLTDGWAENLEESEPSEELLRAVADVSLVVVTGGISYITEHTFRRLLRAFPEDRMPWVASFVIRTFPYDPIADTLADFGLATERLEGATFRQRRFAADEEQQAALQRLHSLGLSTEGLEDEGYYHTEFFLSRPAGDVESQPLNELLTTYRRD